MLRTTENHVIATFLDASGNPVGDSITASFNPDTNSDVAWQYAAKVLIAPGSYASIKIELAYDYNVNTVYFDGIQLYKEEFGSSYTYDANGNVTSTKDIQGGETRYTYNSTHDLIKVELPDETVTTYTYDNYHNVKTATTDTGVVYTFEYDTWGNNTKVSIGSGTNVISASADYSDNGNILESTTDAMGYVTRYGYDADTNVLEWVQYPRDTTATRTEYTYDNMYRMATASSTTSQGYELTAAYTYTNDLLTKIQTGSTAYSFSYGNFAMRSSIQIGSRTLASYSYTSRTNYLSKLDYGNGDKVQYTYDTYGRVTKQTYEDGDTVSYSYDNNGALATVTDSATGRSTTYYYDFTDRMMKYVESGSGYNHSVGYTYDELNNLTALVETINGVTRNTSYTYDDDNRVTSVTTDGVTTSYVYDSYGRLDTKVIKNGNTTVLTENYEYKDNSSGKPTSQVETLTSVSAGRSTTYTYTYDSNGNITSVTDGTYTTSYTYDSANQLTRENNQALGKTWVWTYDDAGNILSRKEYAYTTGTNLGTVLSTKNYTYGDSSWGDLLTGYGGWTFSYDEIGNVTQAGNFTYTWEHGRQLANMTSSTADIDFTYDSNGMRVGKTVTTVTEVAPTQYTVTFVADGVTVDTLTVESGYTLTSADYPAVPEKDGYTGAWTQYTSPVTSNITIQAVYTEDTPEVTTYTVTFVADGVTVDTITVNSGYTLTSADYPEVPEKDGYTGAWTQYTSPVTSNITIQAVYTQISGGGEEADTHTVTFRVSYGASYGYTVKTMEVADGYVLTAADYPSGTGMSYITWEQYTSPIHSDITINGSYSWGGMSADDNAELVESGEGEVNDPVEGSAETASVATTSTTTTTTVTDYDYIYNGGQLTGEVITTTTDGTVTNTETLYYYYDASGTPVSVKYNNTLYFYVTNLQGDVLAIMNASGTIVVEYTYDAWGYIRNTTGSLKDTLGKANALRYRGYVYDTETCLYYLQSRYYNPGTGRFINADSSASTSQGLLSNNMFAYCLNNPVNGCDPCGTCFHRLDFWNDCEKCGGKTITDKWDMVLTSYSVLLSLADFNLVLFSKERTLRPDTGLQDIPDDEIQRRARDKRLPGEERRRYQKEEKKRGLRNKQKRNSNCSVQIDWDPIIGFGVVALGSITITAIVIDDTTVIGVADDGLIIPLLEMIRRGFDAMIR